jgi:hypothetical protein
MTMIAVRLITPGGCETCESAEQQSKSAIQQKHEFAEMITETEIFKGNAERSPHSRSGIGLKLRGGYAGYHERSRKEESSQSTLHPVHFAFLVLSETSVHFYNVQSARESPRRGTRMF